MKIAVAMTVFEHTSELRETLTALRMYAPGTDLFVNADPGGKLDRVILIVREFFPEARVEVNRKRLHNRWNIQRVLHRAFVHHEHVLSLEDDALISLDALDLCRWYFENHSEEFMALCLFNHSRGWEPADAIAESWHFCPWGWAISRGWYQKLLPHWMNDGAHWDASVNVAMKANRWKVLCPLFSRSSHIGRSGAHQKAEDWDRVHGKHRAYAGTPPVYQLRRNIPEGHLKVT